MATPNPKTGLEISHKPIVVPGSLPPPSIKLVIPNSTTYASSNQSENIAKRKISSLGISEYDIIRIAEEINVTRPKHIGTYMTYEENYKLTPEQRKQIKEQLVVISSYDPYNIIVEELNKLLNSLKKMSNDDIRKLYDDIRREQTTAPHIEFTIFRSPVSNRLIANVTELRWNGVDLLSGQNIMLYHSTGKSRLTGLSGYWMPFIGEGYNRVAKLEDNYIKAINEITIDIFPTTAYYKPLLIDIIRNISTYIYYMRFINKKYLIASFLLFSMSDAYISNPANKKHIRHYTDEENSNALINANIKIMKINATNQHIDYIPISYELIDELIKPSKQTGAGNIYYTKYLKYKNKYAMLKNFIVQH